MSRSFLNSGTLIVNLFSFWSKIMVRYLDFETEIENSCRDHTGKTSYFISVKLDMRKNKNTVQGASLSEYRRSVTLDSGGTFLQS